MERGKCAPGEGWGQPGQSGRLVGDEMPCTKGLAASPGVSGVARAQAGFVQDFGLGFFFCPFFFFFFCFQLKSPASDFCFLAARPARHAAPLCNGALFRCLHVPRTCRGAAGTAGSLLVAQPSPGTSRPPAATRGADTTPGVPGTTLGTVAPGTAGTGVRKPGDETPGHKTSANTMQHLPGSGACFLKNHFGKRNPQA